MKLAFRAIIILSFGALGGCSWLMGEDSMFDDSQYDYTKAEFTDELVVPESVGEANAQDLYLVPEADDEAVGEVYGTEKDVFAPMQVLTLGSKIRVNRTSDDSSVYVTETKERMWGLLSKFLLETNISISETDIEKNQLITGWHEIEDDSFWSGEITGWRYSYQITLEPARNSEEQLLTVKLLQAEEFYDNDDEWRAFSDTKRNEAELLNSLLGYMYVEDIKASRLLVNQSGLGGITVTMGSDNEGNPALITSASFEHVWTRVPVSLGLLNIVMDDQDHSQGLYFFNTEVKEGFFESLAFWSDDNEGTLDIPEGVYRIKIASKGEQTSIVFIDGLDTYLNADALAKNFALLAKIFKARAAE